MKKYTLFCMGMPSVPTLHYEFQQPSDQMALEAGIKWSEAILSDRYFSFNLCAEGYTVASWRLTKVVTVTEYVGHDVRGV